MNVYIFLTVTLMDDNMQAADFEIHASAEKAVERAKSFADSQTRIEGGTLVSSVEYTPCDLVFIPGFAYLGYAVFSHRTVTVANGRKASQGQNQPPMTDWGQVKIDAAISAMQGILESGHLGQILETAPEIVAKQSVRLADALVAELRK